MKRLAALLFALSALNGHAFIVEFLVYSETCAGGDGAIIATASGGQAPYTYAWSNAVSGPDNYFLTAGTYSVTVTDNVGATATKQWTLGQVLQPPSNVDQFTYLGLGGLDACPGQCNGGFRLHLPRIQGGYTFSTTPSMTYSLVGNDIGDYVNNGVVYEFLGACSGQSIQLSISNSCGTGYTSGIVIGTEAEPQLTILLQGGSCNGADNGLLNAEVFVPIPPSTWCTWLLSASDGQGGTAQPGNYLFSSSFTETFTLTDLHPGDWTLNFVTSEGQGSLQTPCLFDVPFNIPDLGTDCASVGGTLHFETDADCVQDGLEVGLPYQVLRVTPGPLYGITDADGHYDIAVPFGAYDLEQLNPDAVQLCPPAGPVAFSVSSGTNATVHLADSLLTPFDMHLHLAAGISRVGFPFGYSIDLTNSNGHTGESIVVTLVYDPTLTFVSASPAPTNNMPGQVQWDLAVLAPFGNAHFNVVVQVPPDPLLLGTSFTATATATSATAESNTVNNTMVRTHLIVASYDPNDKQAFTSSQQNNAVYLLDVDEHIDYLIRFQNTGTDTAFTITVTDTISALLDLASLQVLAASHPFTPHIATGRVLEFHFADILLPDSNVNELASHGYVAFRLKPLPGVAIGSTIDNAADIFFDFNEAVRTNTASLEVGVTTGLSDRRGSDLVLSPVPATDRLTIRADGASIVAAHVRALDGRVVARYGAGNTLDVLALAPGTYVLEALTTSGEGLRAAFVKQ